MWRQMPRSAAKAPPVEGWFRQLEDGNVEIFVKAHGRKIRAHGPSSEMNELVDWFEEKTGVTVEASWRVRKASTSDPRPRRQLPLTLEMGEATEAEAEGES
jgi:acylphosphatase